MESGLYLSYSDLPLKPELSKWKPVGHIMDVIERYKADGVEYTVFDRANFSRRTVEWFLDNPRFRVVLVTPYGPDQIGHAVILRSMSQLKWYAWHELWVSENKG